MNTTNLFFNWLLEILEHPLLTNGVIIAIGGLFLTFLGTRQNKKAQIEINSAAEKIKFEIQRKYLLTEIQTRNLLEIYPKLYDSLLEAVSPLAGYFNTIITKVTRIQEENKEPEFHQLKSLIENYFELSFGNLDFKELTIFNNCHASSTLFISESSNEIIKEMKRNLMILFGVVNDHIITKKYLQYDSKKILEFLNKVSIALTALEQDRDHLARQMNKELNPYQ